MDFGSILQYLQGLLSNKQGMQTSEFGQNLGLQQQQLAQQNQQFQGQLGLQTQAERDAANNAAGQLALQNLAQNQGNDLALAQLGQQGSEFAQQLGETGREFTGTLGLQTQAEKDAAANQAGQLALANLTQNQGNALANAQLQAGIDQFNKQFGLQQQGQEYEENLGNALLPQQVQGLALGNQAQGIQNFANLIPYLGHSIWGSNKTYPPGTLIAPQTQPISRDQWSSIAPGMGMPVIRSPRAAAG